MAAAQRGHPAGRAPGKTAELVALLREHGTAIEADLAWRGIDLASLSLRRVGVLVDALLATPGSHLHRALSGDEWTLTDHLLALIHDQLAIANWQRTKDGQKGRRRPKPLSPLLQKAGRRYGRTDRSPDEIKAYLARFGPPPS